MPFYYKIKEGYENRVFAHSRRVSETELESDEELFSPYLEALKPQEAAQTEMTATPPAPSLPPVQNQPGAFPSPAPEQPNMEAKA